MSQHTPLQQAKQLLEQAGFEKIDSNYATTTYRSQSKQVQIQVSPSTISLQSEVGEDYFVVGFALPKLQALIQNPPKKSKPVAASDVPAKGKKEKHTGPTLTQRIREAYAASKEKAAALTELLLEFPERAEKDVRMLIHSIYAVEKRKTS